MAVDNTVQSIVVQTNATDPTQAVLAGRRQGGSVSNIPFIDNDQVKLRVFLVELDQTTGLLRDRKLETGEALDIVIRTAADDVSLAHLNLTVSTLQTAQAATVTTFNVYNGTTRENLGSEYVALSLLNAPLTNFHPIEEKHVYWFRTNTNDMPPNLEGYTNFRVDVAEGDDPLMKLATKMNTTSLMTAIYAENAGFPAITVLATNSGELSVQPFASDSTKLGIEMTQHGKNLVGGYQDNFLLTDATIPTALGSADTVTAKFVVKITDASCTKTVAIQDCTIYRDFSA